jgi:hypothetical protein
MGLRPSDPDAQLEAQRPNFGCIISDGRSGVEDGSKRSPFAVDMACAMSSVRSLSPPTSAAGFR